MTIYTDADAKARLETVLDDARRSGEVRIRRNDGEEFIVRPAPSQSTLDVGTIPVTLGTDEIIDAVRESRNR